MVQGVSAPAFNATISQLCEQALAAEHELSRAIEMNKRAGAHPYVALSQLDLAGVYIRRGRADELGPARELIGDASATFVRLGMAGPHLAATALLERSRALAATTSVLSKREFEIAGLVANDASNLAIAERLFISERTVESHVRNILTKLGGTKRAHITAWVRTNDVGSRP